MLHTANGFTPPPPPQTQVLLVTSYMRATVELRDGDGGRFTAEGEMNATITGLSPATQYSLTLTFIFIGSGTGPPTPSQTVTTLDDSKSHDCRVSYSTRVRVCVLIWPSLCVDAIVCVCVCVVSRRGEWYTFLHSKQLPPSVISHSF